MKLFALAGCAIGLLVTLVACGQEPVHSTAEQLTAMGVTAAGADGWYQAVALRQYKIDTDSAQASIHRDGEESVLTCRDDFAMLADAVRPETSLCAEVAYVGFGVHAPEYGYSDYDGIDVRGKIVAGFRGAPEIIEGDARTF